MTLPIDRHRERILESVCRNPVTIVVGETGSGKTTRIPLYLLEDGFGRWGVIGITEPRRVATISVAKYVAGLLGEDPGSTVGYQIRFQDVVSSCTKIKFMTDGILLRELKCDQTLNKYSVIVIDEAHERSVNIDLLLGLTKELLKRRDDIRIIITSATIDAEKFSRYFDSAPIISVEGRTHPVRMHWSVRDIDDGDEMLDAAVAQVKAIHETQPEGDVLVFLTGEREIQSVIRGIDDLGFSDLLPLPAYAALAPEDQLRIFESCPGKRKVVVATNIAETSITIDGVVYVVDSGLIKQKNFNLRTGIESLEVAEHSRAGCDQRAGRAGRTREGICYCLYSRENYEHRPEFTRPEIQRTNLAGVVLAMEDLGIGDVPNFDFIDPPESDAFLEAYETLGALGAIRKNGGGLTPLGSEMAELPLEPRVSRMLLEAKKYGCVREIALISAFFSARNLYIRPMGEEYAADCMHRAFHNSHSDALTFLSVWERYEWSGRSEAWCKEHYLNNKTLQEAANISGQLIEILSGQDIAITSGAHPDMIARAVAAGCARGLLEFSSRFAYRSMMRQHCDRIFIHPSSALFRAHPRPRWIVAMEIVTTSKTFARNCTQVNPEWLPDIAPHLFSWEESSSRSRRRRGQEPQARRTLLYRGRKVGEAAEKDGAGKHRNENRKQKYRNKKGGSRRNHR